MKNGSPLGCCIPSGERQNMNPVFKQQYVNEGGKIKMAVPLSPMHYITNANVYGYDERFPPRFDPSFAYYNERIYKPRNMDFEYKEQKFVTPAMSFITQPRRNMSAQVIDSNSQMQEISRSNSINFAQILTSINEKLSKIEFMCKNNQEDIYEIKHLIKPHHKEGVIEGGTRLVIRKLNSGQTLKREDGRIGDENPVNSKSEPPTHTESLCHDQLVTVASEMTRVDDKMLDLSEELKNSNDMLEHYVRNVKFDNLTCLENKLDVMSSDFAKIRGEIQPFDVKPKAEPEGVSMLSNIESKFKKLFSRFDSNPENSLALKPMEPSNQNETGGSIVKLGETMNTPESNTESMESTKTVEISVKIPEITGKTGEISTKTGAAVLSGEMMNLLKGLPLDSKINEIGLTEDEIVFLRNLNHTNSDSLGTAHTHTHTHTHDTDTKSVNLAEFDEKESDDDFGCRLLAPTRADFTPLLDDSIHDLNSSSFS